MLLIKKVHITKNSKVPHTDQQNPLSDQYEVILS